VSPVTPDIQRLQGRRIEESLRDHNRNRRPLNQHKNRDYIVLDKVHGRGPWGMTIKANVEYLQICGGTSSVRLTYGWHSGGAGNNRTKVGGPWDGYLDNRASNIRQRDPAPIPLSDAEDKGKCVIGRP